MGWPFRRKEKEVELKQVLIQGIQVLVKFSLVTVAIIAFQLQVLQAFYTLILTSILGGEGGYSIPINRVGNFLKSNNIVKGVVTRNKTTLLFTKKTW